jgi:hypothetical protein
MNGYKQLSYAVSLILLWGWNMGSQLMKSESGRNFGSVNSETPIANFYLRIKEFFFVIKHQLNILGE